MSDVIDTKELELKSEISNVETQANALVISDEESLKLATKFIQDVKNVSLRVADFFKPLKDAAFKTHRALCDRENETLKPLQSAEKTAKQKIKAYMDRLEAERILKEQQIKAEQKKATDNLINQAAELEGQGKTEEANELLQQAEITETIAGNMSIAKSTPKVDGLSSQVDYEIIVTNMDEVPVKVAGICIRPIDLSSVKRLVKLAKGNITIPGIEIKKTSIVKVGGAR